MKKLAETMIALYQRDLLFRVSTLTFFMTVVLILVVRPGGPMPDRPAATHTEAAPGPAPAAPAAGSLLTPPARRPAAPARLVAPIQLQ